MNKLKRIFKGNSGQGMVEYGLILALVSIISIASLSLLGGGVSGKFDDVLNVLGDEGGSPVGISTDADYENWGPLEELGEIPADAYYANNDDDFEKILGVWRYQKASDPDASDYEPVVIIPKRIKGELVTTYKNMFNGTYVTAVYAEDSGAVTSMEGMFMSLKSTSLLIDRMDTSNVTNMKDMFRSAGSRGIWSPANPITSFTFGNLDTSNVTNMEGMFNSASISRVDLRRMDTSSVVNMRSMFEGLANSAPMRLNVTSFDTRNVEWARDMFSISPVVELDVRNFRSDSMDEGTDGIHYMFERIKVPMLDLSQFKLTPNLYGGSMFFSATIDTLDLSGMELAGTDENDWSRWTGMLQGAKVENAYVKTDADATILNMVSEFYKNFVGLPN